MNRTVYFADRAVAFTAEAPGGAWYAVAAEACGGISRAKILNFLESHNSVAVVSDDPDRAFAAFAAEFTPVEAAGGVVVNDCGEWLMIHRNGRWDLPKGHLECGERIEACAARVRSKRRRAWRLGSCGRCARRCTPTIFRKLRAGN